MKNARQRIKDKNRTLRREVKRESDIYERERESGEWGEWGDVKMEEQIEKEV